MKDTGFVTMRWGCRPSKGKSEGGLSASGDCDGLMSGADDDDAWGFWARQSRTAQDFIPLLGTAFNLK